LRERVTVPGNAQVIGEWRLDAQVGEIPGDILSWGLGPASRRSIKMTRDPPACSMPKLELRGSPWSSVCGKRAIAAQSGAGSASYRRTSDATSGSFTGCSPLRQVQNGVIPPDLIPAIYDDAAAMDAVITAQPQSFAVYFAGTQAERWVSQHSRRSCSAESC
jgi:hypothetical protein